MPDESKPAAQTSIFASLIKRVARPQKAAATVVAGRQQGSQTPAPTTRQGESRSTTLPDAGSVAAEAYQAAKATPQRSALSALVDRSAVRHAKQEPASESLREEVGVVERVRVFGDWAIGIMWVENRTEVKITGAAVGQLIVGREYTVKGTTKVHPKHGESLEVVVAEPFIRPNEVAITRFIVETFKGIGPKTAEKYVKAVKAMEGEEGLEAVRQRLLKQPWLIADEISRVTSKKGTYDPQERESVVQAFVERDLATKLGGSQGIRDSVIKALAKYLVERARAVHSDEQGALFERDPVTACWAELVADPYEPAKTVPGYGFVMADAIGRSVNIPREAPQRLAALVAFAVLDECAQHGHVYLSEQAVLGAILKFDQMVDPVKAIRYAADHRTVAIEGDRVYPFAHLSQEKSLAKLVSAMISGGAPLSKLSPQGAAVKVQEAAKSLGAGFKDGLDPTQLSALTSILTSGSRIHTVTAGPGCGKTALMEVLVKVLEGRQAVFCSPTGKGAKVLSSRISRFGLKASTLHSLLKGSGPGAFMHDQKNPLSGDFMVIDEAGMIDLGMMQSALAAAGRGMHVILLGDDDQLRSIGAGRVLSDLLEVDGIDHNRLTKTHRNSGGILDVVNEIKAGRLATNDRDGVSFSGQLADASQQFPVVMRAYLEAVERLGFENVSMLLSRKKGDAGVPGWNTTFANACLREVCNPGGVKIPGTRFYSGDRIIIRENMDLQSGEKVSSADMTVVNGDTGTLLGFTKTPGAQQGGAQFLKIKLDDGRIIEYPGESASALDHSYAMTVHSAQGSEYKEVIAVITPGQPSFINRSTIYTAFSRPKDRLRVFADDAALRRIAAMPAPARNSALVERISTEMSADDETDPDTSSSHAVRRDQFER